MKVVSTTRRYAYTGALLVCLGMLFWKFYWSYVHFGVPLGYDVGMYRYLFLKHAAAFPPFVLGDVQDWAKDHPLGLFILFMPFMKLGLPVDWVIGWIWNAVAVLLPVTLAWAISTSPVFRSTQHSTRALFLSTLVAGTLSLPMYDGFAFMYFKTFVSVLFMVVTFALIERKSYFAFLTGIFTVITHHQTGLLFVLCVAVWWAMEGIRRKVDRTWLLFSVCGLGAMIVAALVYAPVFHEAITQHLPLLLTKFGADVPSGAFESIGFYWPVYKILIALSIAGFVLHLRFSTVRWSLWHSAVAVSALFLLFKLYFYSRFLLHLDFFLLPFAGFAILTFWKRWQWWLPHAVITLILVVQGLQMLEHLPLRTPRIHKQTYEAIKKLPEVVSSDALLVGYENITALWLRGWLPDTRVVAPGFFEPFATLEDWEYFLIADQRFRKMILGGEPVQAYFFLPEEFILTHGEEKYDSLARDPCFRQNIDIPELFVSVCSPTE